MMYHSPYALGATLYMPATREDIIQVALNEKIPNLKSMVICLEDSVANMEIPQALENLKNICHELTRHKKGRGKTLIFVRPRNLSMAQYIVSEFDLFAIDGLVLPKFTLASLSHWQRVTQKTALLWMPTLETAEVFSEKAMQKLAKILSNHCMKQRIIALRIGGNDLMNLISIRRSRAATLYDGPLGYVIKMLCCTFGAYGFSLTAPVCEIINDNRLLEQELKQDLLHGLVGKTAIHPSQIDCIQNAWRVEHSEYQEAMRILNSTKAVYQYNGAMCEPATHMQWAKHILERRRYFGAKIALEQGSLSLS